MATHNEKLASSLEILRSIQERGIRVVRIADHKELTRAHRERLVKANFLQPIIPGWYLPDTSPMSCQVILQAGTPAWTPLWLRMPTTDSATNGNSPAEQSLLSQAGETTMSRQIQIHAVNASNDIVTLPHNCSLFLYKIMKEALTRNPVTQANGLRLIPLEECLFRLPATFFVDHPQAAQIALRRADINEISRLVLQDGSTTVAGRLVGAFQAAGRADDAKQLNDTMVAAGHSIRVAKPVSKCHSR